MPKVIDLLKQPCEIDIEEEHLSRGFTVKGLLKLAGKDTIKFYIFPTGTNGYLGMTIQCRDNNWKRIRSFEDQYFTRRQYATREVIEWIWLHALLLQFVKHDL